MIAGARQGRTSVLRMLTAKAIARNLSALVVPGSEVLRVRGLDIEAADLRRAVTPRDASVLLLIGELPDALRDAAVIAYAQMPRPRAVLVLGGGGPASPLPVDISAALTQSALNAAARNLRAAMSQGAFSTAATEFDAAVLHGSVQYVCPMHPDVIEEQPGSCPKCGMRLIAQGGSAGAGPAAPSAASEAGHPAHHDHAHHEHDASTPGTHDHDGMDFMSMIEVTKDLPRSRDGLPMDWIDVPFGPLFPGLPGGLRLMLTLDGDGVARGAAESLVGVSGRLQAADVARFVEHLSNRMVLASTAYRVLVCRALEQAAGIAADEAEANARLGVLERERIASHLNWLAQLAQQIGFAWLARRAAALQQRVQQSGREQLMALRPDLLTLTRRLRRTPLLKSQLAGKGRTAAIEDLRGPVARAAGCREDARLVENAYRRLGFEPVLRSGGDAWDRLNVRLAEIEQSLDLIDAAGVLDAPILPSVGDASGDGIAVIETPRGRVELRLTLARGRVTDARLDTACTRHLALVSDLVLERELGDALVAVGSLDISPWEVVQ